MGPQKFATWFNRVVLGAYRQITAQDVRDMAECGLVCRFGYYGPSDLQTVIGILNYEQMREEKSQKPDTEDRRCKRCGQLLYEKVNGKGRPREYCQQCESSRVRERHKRWRKRQMNRYIGWSYWLRPEL